MSAIVFSVGPPTTAYNNVALNYNKHRRNFCMSRCMVTFESGGGCHGHHHFLKWNLQFSNCILEFGQENRTFLATRSVLWPKTCRKCDSGRGSTLDPAGGVDDAPPDSLVGWGGAGEGTSLPITDPTRGFGASMLAPSAARSSCPLTPNPGDATGQWSPPLCKVNLRQC